MNPTRTRIVRSLPITGAASAKRCRPRALHADHRRPRPWERPIGEFIDRRATERADGSAPGAEDERGWAPELVLRGTRVEHPRDGKSRSEDPGGLAEPPRDARRGARVAARCLVEHSEMEEDFREAGSRGPPLLVARVAGADPSPFSPG